MKKSSELRKFAKSRLNGKWNTAALFLFIYVFFTTILNMILSALSINEDFVSLICTIFNLLLAFGLTDALFKLFSGEDVKISYLFTSSFQNIKKTFSIYFHMLLKLIGPFILFVISIFLIIFMGLKIYSYALYAAMSSSSSSSSGLSLLILITLGILIFSIIWLTTKSYYYKLAFTIAVAHPEKTGKDAINESEKLMKGKRWKYFCLELSFIGWILLSIITLGIGALWVTPYLYFAQFAFYKNALGEALDMNIISETEE